MRQEIWFFAILGHGNCKKKYNLLAEIQKSKKIDDESGLRENRVQFVEFIQSWEKNISSKKKLAILQKKARTTHQHKKTTKFSILKHTHNTKKINVCVPHLIKRCSFNPPNGKNTSIALHCEHLLVRWPVGHIKIVNTGWCLGHLNRFVRQRMDWGHGKWRKSGSWLKKSG